MIDEIAEINEKLDTERRNYEKGKHAERQHLCKEQKRLEWERGQFVEEKRMD